MFIWRTRCRVRQNKSVSVVFSTLQLALSFSSSTPVLPAKRFYVSRSREQLFRQAEKQGYRGTVFSIPFESQDHLGPWHGLHGAPQLPLLVSQGVPLRNRTTSRSWQTIYMPPGGPRWSRAFYILIGIYKMFNVCRVASLQPYWLTRFRIKR